MRSLTSEDGMLSTKAGALSFAGALLAEKRREPRRAHLSRRQGLTVALIALSAFATLTPILESQVDPTIIERSPLEETTRSVPRPSSSPLSPAISPTLLAPESTPDSKGPSAPTNADWTESKLGTIPNSFGQLFTIAGDASNQYTLVFQNAGLELRLIAVPGSKLRRSILHIDRHSADSANEKPPSGDSKKKPESVPPEEGWTTNHVGSIPERFGQLVAVSGTRGKGGGYTFVFSDDDQNIRLVFLQGNRLKKEASLYTVDALASSESVESAPTKRPKRRAETRPSVAPPAPDGWSDVLEGSIPEHFGTLIAAASNDQRTTLTFQAGFGELTTFNVQPGKSPKSARLILRTVPSKEELRGRDQEDKELRKKGFDWKISYAGVIPDAYGDLHRIDVQLQLSMLFQDPEGQLRLVQIQGNNVPDELSRIERPESTFTKTRVDAEGWNESAIGAIPEHFGNLRAMIGSPQSPLQLLLAFQGEAGEIRVIHRTGRKLPNKLSRIDIEY